MPEDVGLAIWLVPEVARISQKLSLAVAAGSTSASFGSTRSFHAPTSVPLTIRQLLHADCLPCCQLMCRSRRLQHPSHPSPAPSCLCSLLLSWQWSRKTGRLHGRSCSSSLICGRWSACPGPSGWLSRIALMRHGRPSCERPNMHCSCCVSNTVHGRL